MNSIDEHVKRVVLFDVTEAAGLEAWAYKDLQDESGDSREERIVSVLRKLLPSLRVDTARDYLRVNDRVYAVHGQELDRFIRLISQDEVTRAFREGFVEMYYGLENGLSSPVTVSAVGVSDDGSQALLLRSKQHGDLILLSRVGGNWKIEDVARLWWS